MVQGEKLEKESIVKAIIALGAGLPKEHKDHRLLGRSQYELDMESFGTRLNIENKLVEAKDVAGMSKSIVEQSVGPTYLGYMDEAMRYMVEHQLQRQSSEPLIGPVFTTGNNDGLGVMVLLPSREGDKIGSHAQSDIVIGTPALVQLRDHKLAKELKTLSYPEQALRVRAIMIDKALRVERQQGKATVSWGGWGSSPWYLMRRHELALQCMDEATNTPHELTISLGLLGAAFTLNKVGIEDKIPMLKLDMFVGQLNSALAGVAALLDPSKYSTDVMRLLSPDLIGHSMGGYLALMAAKNRNLSMIGAIKEAGRANFIADKPVMMGAKYTGMVPSWMDDVMESPTYQAQVKLQDGAKGGLIRAGVHRVWDLPLGLAYVRRELGPLIKPIEQMFEDFLTPQRVWDGKTIFDAHVQNYFSDRVYHELCVALLDSAVPVIGDQTMIDSQKRMNFVKILIARGDQILKHDFVDDMARALEIPDQNILQTRGGAHHANLQEIAWMMGLETLADPV